MHNELRRKGMTLELLWKEYKTESPDVYQFNKFCEHYRRDGVSKKRCRRGKPGGRATVH
ncbi:hypothetical protein [Janthinobacterium sp. NKUCC06_STL]|uniref:hypothetical protein n=1 Tax=Janthinobacterium sp. NKUCC06_STL TaxID=2842127 RepID=UPI001C5ACCD2|nr:hypothetical protein [Janthinobacterium sp. NKUCC06_STL]MBW3512134.1 hypothetical protein [Janthinobacterium sp. NKUCC06_STL]